MTEYLDIDLEDRLALVPRDIKEKRAIVLGASGMGKSNTVAVIVEEDGEREPFIIVDPHGEYYTLGEKFPDVLVIGQSEHIHLEANVENAPKLAAWIYETRRSVILDVLWMERAERAAFIKAFFDAFWMKVKRGDKRPFLVVIDEAHNFIPEVGNPPIKETMITLALEGRKFGLSIVLSTQTTTEIDKAVLKQMGIRIFHAVFDSSDLARLLERMPGDSKANKQAVLSLRVGEALVVIGAHIFRAQIRRRTTFHVGETPEIGAALPVIQPVNAAMLDELRALLSGSQANSAPDEQAAAELLRLRRRVTELENEPPRLIKVQVPILGREERAELVEFMRSLEVMFLWLQAKLAGYMPTQATVIPLQAPPAPLIPAAIEPSAPTELDLPDDKADAETLDEDESGITQGALKILQALELLAPKPLTRTQIGVLARLSSTGGSFNSNLADLKRWGYIDEQSGVVSITEDGAEASGGEWLIPTTRRELIDAWKLKLTAGAQRMLETLIRSYPNCLTRKALGDATTLAASGGSFNENLSRMERAGLIIRERDQVRASEALFLVEG